MISTILLFLFASIVLFYQDLGLGPGSLPRLPGGSS